MSIARPVSLLLNVIALALCLYALLLKPHIVILLCAIFFAAVIGVVATRQAGWLAVLTGLLCLVVGTVCAVAAFEIWRTGDWYGTPTGRITFFATLVPLGAVGPLVTVYVLYQQYLRPGARPEALQPGGNQ